MMPSLYASITTMVMARGRAAAADVTAVAAVVVLISASLIVDLLAERAAVVTTEATEATEVTKKERVLPAVEMVVKEVAAEAEMAMGIMAEMEDADLVGMAVGNQAADVWARSGIPARMVVRMEAMVAMVETVAA